MGRRKENKKEISLKCDICKKEIKTPHNPVAGLLLDVDGRPSVFGTYHCLCLLQKLKELLGSGEIKNESKQSRRK